MKHAIIIITMLALFLVCTVRQVTESGVNRITGATYQFSYWKFGIGDYAAVPGGDGVWVSFPVSGGTQYKLVDWTEVQTWMEGR